MAEGARQGQKEQVDTYKREGAGGMQYALGGTTL